MRSRAERLQEFFRRLGAAPVASSFEEAYNQVCSILDATEDDSTGLPNDPTTMGRDGRLYPPQWDNELSDPDFIGARAFKNRRHFTVIGENGGIAFIDRTTGMAVFRKPGSDGRDVMEKTTGGRDE